MRFFVLLLVVMVLCPSTAFAQGRFGLRGVGLEIGVVNPEDADATVGGGVFASLDVLNTSFLVEPYLDYWSQSETVAGVGEFYARDMTLGGRGKYNFTLSNPAIQPFVGAGLGLHFFKAEVQFEQFGGLELPGLDAEDSDLKLGLDLGTGVAMSLKSVELRGEAWYSVVSNINQLALRFGVMFPLGK